MITDISDENEILFDYIDLLSDYKQIRVRKLLKKGRRITINQIIMGELLLKYILMLYYNIQPEKVIIQEMDSGKPFLVNQKLFFNISHSGNKIICSCSKHPVGVDVQEINKQMSMNPWLLSKIEAYCKRHGLGIHDTFLRMGKINYRENHLDIEKCLDLDNQVFQKLYEEKYIISISHKHINALLKNVEIREVDCEEVLRKVNM